MEIEKIIKLKHAEIVRVAKKYGALKIQLFGSAARGETNESSDLDFLVEMKHGTSLLDIIAIKQDLEDLLGVEVDVVTKAAISPYIRDEILKEAVNL